MRELSLRSALAVMLLVVVPVACGDDPSNPSGGGSGSGGSSAGGSGGTAAGGSGGSSAKGGSGGGSTAAGGSGGSTTSAGGSGGAASGGSGSGGSTVAGGSGGGGGTATGGSARGGATGSGGTATGGGGASGGGAGGAAGAGGTSAGGASGGDGGTDAETASCEDKKTNGAETDVDCGGGDCQKCDGGKICKVDDDCKSGSCDDGKCGDPFAPTGTITNQGNIWKITAGATTLEVDQAVAGKITSFAIDGTNFLVINDASTGSVFWTAPQAEWNDNGWPPPEELDTKAYTPSSKDNVLTMTGPTGTTGAVTKRFWANVENQTVTIEYTFKNTTSAAVKKAPWEITRVYPGGLTFFPTAEEPVRLGGVQDTFKAVPFTTSGGIAWWKYLKAEFTQDIKGGADGLEGWAAHINCGTEFEKTCAAGGKSIVMIKQWQDATTEAPNEKEIEIYANAGHNYVEFEQQGDYQSIAAGGSMVWTMRWMLRYLPADVPPTPGSEALANWVRGQLK